MRAETISPTTGVDFEQRACGAVVVPVERRRSPLPAGSIHSKRLLMDDCTVLVAHLDAFFSRGRSVSHQFARHDPSFAPSFLRVRKLLSLGVGDPVWTKMEKETRHGTRHDQPDHKSVALIHRNRASDDQAKM
jgi:hypothetical protein